MGIIEAKDNECQAVFYCTAKKMSECVYYIGQQGICKYADIQKFYSYCNSAIARMNRVVLIQKTLKGE